jgi:FAD synthase
MKHFVGEKMNHRKHIKRLYAGKYVAEVEVEILNNEEKGWAPYLSLEDTLKLDRIRKLLKNGEISEAKKLAKRIFLLTPVAA